MSITVIDGSCANIYHPKASKKTPSQTYRHIRPRAGISSRSIPRKQLTTNSLRKERRPRKHKHVTNFLRNSGQGTNTENYNVAKRQFVGEIGVSDPLHQAAYICPHHRKTNIVEMPTELSPKSSFPANPSATHQHRSCHMPGRTSAFLSLSFLYLLQLHSSREPWK